MVSSSEAVFSIAAESPQSIQSPFASVRKRKISSNGSMNTVEKKVGSLWKGCLNDTAARSGGRKQEIMAPEGMENGMTELVRSVGIMDQRLQSLGKPTWRIIKWDGSNHSWEEFDADNDEGCPSKFLILCLNSIQNALQQDEAFSAEDDRPFLPILGGLSSGVVTTMEMMYWIRMELTQRLR